MAQQAGYYPEVILSGRRINDSMGVYVAQNTIKLLVKAKKPVHSCNVAILGLTFKENCPDIRNTLVIDIIKELGEHGITPLVCDPVASKEEALLEYGINLVDLDVISGMDAIVLAVPHNVFLNLDYKSMISNQGIIIDVKGTLNGNNQPYTYWRL